MILTVHVKPNARKTQFISWLDERTVVIALAAPATEGKANEELVDFLAEKLDLAKSLIGIKRGHTSKVKHLELPANISLAGLKG